MAHQTGSGKVGLEAISHVTGLSILSRPLGDGANTLLDWKPRKATVLSI